MGYRLKSLDDENSVFADKPKMLASCFFEEKGIILECQGRNLSSAICTEFRRGGTKKQPPLRKAAVLCTSSASGKQVHFVVERLLRVEEAPQTYVAADTPAGVFCQVHLIKKIAMMGEGA